SVIPVGRTGLTEAGYRRPKPHSPASVARRRRPGYDDSSIRPPPRENPVRPPGSRPPARAGGLVLLAVLSAAAACAADPPQVPNTTRGLTSPGSPNPDPIEFFEKKVRPVLAKHWYSCHS